MSISAFHKAMRAAGCALWLLTGLPFAAAGQDVDLTRFGFKYREVEIKLRAFIPSEVVSGGVNPCNPLSVFLGDNRTYDYSEGESRYEYVVRVTTDPRKPVRVSPPKKLAGVATTTRVDKKWAEHVPGEPQWWWRLKNPKPPKEKIDQEVPENIEVEDGTTNQQSTVYRNPFIVMRNDTLRNPFCEIPLIDYPVPHAKFEIAVAQCGSNLFYSLSALHDSFPAYELYIDRVRVDEYMPDSDDAPRGMLGNPEGITKGPTDVFRLVPWTLLGDKPSKEATILNSAVKYERAAIPIPVKEALQPTQLNLVVERGERVFFGASGSMNYGAVVGLGNADGVFTGQQGPEVKRCTPYPEYKHGAVLLGFEGSSKPFMAAGLESTFLAPRSGRLIAIINDSCHNDNDGEYRFCAVKTPQ